MDPFNAVVLGLLVILVGSAWFLFSGKTSESPERKAARDIRTIVEKLDVINGKLDTLLANQTSQETTRR